MTLPGFSGRRAGRSPVQNTTAAAGHALQRPHRVCLFGLFGLGNFGNDGSLEAMVLTLRRVAPGVVLSCICVDPEKIGKTYGISAVPISLAGFSHPLLRLLDKMALTVPGKLVNWLRAIRYIRQFDALIIPGMSILSDYRAGPLGAPYGLFRWAVAAKISGTKLYLVSIGAARMHHRASRWMLTRVAAMADYRSFRDVNSRELVAKLGVGARQDTIHPDLVFRLPTPPLRRRPDAGQMTVGIGMIDYQGWHSGHAASSSTYATYLDKMTRFIDALRCAGFRIRLLIGEEADARAVADVRDRLVQRQDRRSAGMGDVLAEPIGSLHDLMEQIGDTDLVVAARFHNLVCAMKMGIPAISIGYEPKNDALLRNMGLGAFCYNIETFDDGVVLQQVSSLLAKRQDRVAFIQERLLEIENALQEQERDLVTLLRAARGGAGEGPFLDLDSSGDLAEQTMTQSVAGG